MNTKRIFSAACAVIMTCSLSATAFAGCTQPCDHVYTWNTDREVPATCTTEGSREGLCGICGDVVTEPISVDPNAHKWGDWVVTPPTETDTGSAKLTCTLNSSHVVNATLPALTDNGYTVEVITPATVLSEGESQYSYPNDNGAITFTVKTPKKTISTVKDVVDLASANAGEISKSAGITEMPVNGQQMTSKYYYEFGDGYTHIYGDGDGREFYCTVDESTTQGIYAIEISNVKYTLDDKGYPTEKTNNGDLPFQNTGLDKLYMLGYHFSLGYTGIGGMYGAEGVLSGLYRIASENLNNDMKENYEILSDGSVSGNFSFGYFSDVNWRFSVVQVSFTLYNTLSIKSLDVVSRVYGGDDDGFRFEEEVVDSDTTYYHVKDGASPHGTERIQVNQERKQDVATQVGANPYPQNSLLVKSFNLTHKVDGQEQSVGDEAVEVSAGEARTFRITDVKHVSDEISNIAYDPVTAYLRMNGKDTELTASYTDNGNNVSAVVGNCKNSETLKNLYNCRGCGEHDAVTIRCYRLGDVQVVLKTLSGNFEKVINLNVGNAKGPSDLLTQVNMYHQSGYIWEPYLNIVGDLTIYVGQTLEFTAQAPETEQSYTDASYEAVITDEMISGNTAGANLYVNNGFTSFIAAETGEYEIELKATVANSNNVYANTFMYVTVVETPDITALLGTYETRISDPEEAPAVITFGTPEYDSENNVYNGTLTVEFKFRGGAATETLSYTFTPATVETVDGVRTYNAPVLTTAHESGAELGCALTINDAYGITLRHPREVGGQFEEVLFGIVIGE